MHHTPALLQPKDVQASRHRTTPVLSTQSERTHSMLQPPPTPLTEKKKYITRKLRKNYKKQKKKKTQAIIMYLCMYTLSKKKNNNVQAVSNHDVQGHSIIDFRRYGQHTTASGFFTKFQSISSLADVEAGVSCPLGS